MKKKTIVSGFIFIFIIQFIPCGYHVHIPHPIESGNTEPISSESITYQGTDFFTKNLGQCSHNDVEYYYNGNGLNVLFYKSSVEYSLLKYTREGTLEFTYKTTFIGSNRVQPLGVNKLQCESNYLLGNRSDAWYIGIPNYREIEFPRIYENIDLIYHLSGPEMKYEFVVHPGGDVSELQILFDGIEALELDEGNGDLLLSTPLGQVREYAPVSFQVIHGEMVNVESEFIKMGSNVVGFQVQDFDQSIPLVVDPGLNYSSYIGGSESDRGYSLCVDDKGSSYFTGSTSSVNLPIMNGPPNNTYHGSQDVFIVKMNPEGTDLVYSTYIGGRMDDESYDIAIYPNGGPVITGYTESHDFPTTNDAYQGINKGTPKDAFLLILGADGSTLRYSTYLGGTYSETGYGVYVDDTGHTYVTGYTTSFDFPTSQDANDTSQNGKQDVFICKFNKTLTDLDFSTYIGGSEKDIAYDICSDESSFTYIAGYSMSEDFPVTSGSFDGTFNKNNETSDSFVLKLAKDGSTIEYSTFIGGNHTDISYGITLDDDDCPIITGETLSSDFPVSHGSFDTEFNGRHGRDSEAFVTKLEHDGSAIVFSTFVGGTIDDIGYDIATDDLGRIFIVGATKSPDFPVTEGAYEESKSGTNSTSDVFITKLDGNGSSIVYSTFFGGSENDVARSLAIDGQSSVYFSGYTSSTDYPTLIQSFDSTYNLGRYDAFISKLDDTEPPIFISDNTKNETATGALFQFDVTIADNNGVSGAWVIFWYGNDSSSSTNSTLLLSDGDERFGNWTTDISVQIDAPDNLTYYFVAIDRAGIINKTANKLVSIMDRYNPEIVDLSKGNATTGDVFVLSSFVIDNVGIKAVHCIYWYDDDPERKMNWSMDYVETNRTGNGLYLLDNVTVQTDSIAPLNYYFIAIDTSENINVTAVKVVNVFDNDAPMMVRDASDDPAFTGDSYTFKVEASDNIGIFKVHVIYWYGSEGGTQHRVEMTFEGLTDEGLSVFGSNLTNVPLNGIDPLHYFFRLNDTSGNVKETVNRMVEVIDNDPPFLLDDQSDGEATTGDPYQFKVMVTDNIGIDGITVSYNISNGIQGNTSLLAENVTTSGNGTYLSLIYLDPNVIGTLSYYLTIIDLEGNLNITPEVTLGILDNDGPVLGVDESDDSPMTGLNFTFRINVTDNIGVKDVHVNYWSDNSLIENRSLEFDDIYQLTILIDRELYPQIYYRFSAVDASENWNWTEVSERNVLNAPPRLMDPPQWEILEEEVSLFDLGPYIFDDDDDISNITMHCSAENISIEGHSLRGFFIDWIHDYNITITLMDKINIVNTTLRIHIINVNDPPIEPIIRSPVNGSKFKEGEPIKFDVEFYDPDFPIDRSLEIVWESDISREFNRYGSEDAIPFFISDLDPGKHEVTVTVSDGQYSNSTSITIWVDQEVTDPIFSYWVILIVVIMIFIIIFLIMWRKNKTGTV